MNPTCLLPPRALDHITRPTNKERLQLRSHTTTTAITNKADAIAITLRHWIARHARPATSPMSAAARTPGGRRPWAHPGGGSTLCQRPSRLCTSATRIVREYAAESPTHLCLERRRVRTLASKAVARLPLRAAGPSSPRWPRAKPVPHSASMGPQASKMRQAAPNPRGQGKKHTRLPVATSFGNAPPSIHHGLGLWAARIYFSQSGSWTGNASPRAPSMRKLDPHRRNRLSA